MKPREPLTDGYRVPSFKYPNSTGRIINMIEIKKISPKSAQAAQLIEELDLYQSSLYPPESNHLDSLDELSRENVLFIGAFFKGVLKGIGAVKIMGGAYGEIKRVYVSPEGRGKGIARAVMDVLERHLVDNGVRRAKLETGIHQDEAIALYRNMGYTDSEPFGDYKPDPLSLFLVKRLAP